MTATLTEAPRSAPVEPYRLSPQSRRVFVGLMLGMLVASISQTIVGPAMPRIVAELGGMDHYSWVATAAMLVSRHHRSRSSASCPTSTAAAASTSRASPSSWSGRSSAGSPGTSGCSSLGRAIQGLGMGTLMPLSQTIIGDIIPARQRGKYQGLMGAVFGVTSVAGPLAGGFITDHWGWRWLFFAAVPIGLVATVVIARFLHLPHERARGPDRLPRHRDPDRVPRQPAARRPRSAARRYAVGLARRSSASTPSAPSPSSRSCSSSAAPRSR